MKYLLWVLQGLLAFAFIGAGLMKLTTPVVVLASENAWAAAVPGWLIPIIGLCEVAGALGLILPAATRIQPWLTVLAAELLVVVMVLAAIAHLVVGDGFGAVVPPLVLGSLSAFVAYGRHKLVPIEPK